MSNIYIIISGMLQDRTGIPFLVSREGDIHSDDMSIFISYASICVIQSSKFRYDGLMEAMTDEIIRKYTNDMRSYKLNKLVN